MPPVIIYRSDGPWGPGKGSDLDAPEIDANFYNTEQAITGLETNPPQPVSIDHFVIEGSLLTIVLTNGQEHGPFVLPMAQWRWTGPWQPMTQYFVGDILTEGGNTYFVRVQHISEATFDPGLFGPEGFVYVLLLSTPTAPYDVAFYFRDRVISGTATIAMHLLARTIDLPADFAGAVARLSVPPISSAINLPIFHNDTQIGTLTFDIGSQDGVFASLTPPSPPSPPAAPITLVKGDTLEIRLPPENDDAAEGLAVTIPAATPDTASP